MGRGPGLEARKHGGFVTENFQDLFSGSSESEGKGLVRATSQESPQSLGKPFLRQLLQRALVPKFLRFILQLSKPYLAIFGSLVA